jgi:hypothetical protein
MSQAQNYLKLEALLHRPEPVTDPSYQAALYLLSTDTELTSAAAKYIDSDGIDFTEIKQVTRGFDERTRQLIDVAHNLFSWNSACTVTPYDLSRLCYPMLDQVSKALFISAGQLDVQIQGRDTALPHMELNDAAYQKTVRFNNMLQQMQKAACTPQVPEL